MEPRNLRLASGESGTSTLRLDLTDYAEELERIILVTDRGETGTRSFVIVRAFVDVTDLRSLAPVDGGDCSACEEAEHFAQIETLRATLEGKTVHAKMFFSAGCRSCQRLLDNEIPRIGQRSGVSFDIEQHNILEEESFGYLAGRLEILGVEAHEFPLMIIGAQVLQGERAIRTYLEEVAGGDAFGDTAPSRDVRETGGSSSRLAPVPVLTAGLIDGINPCAFTTLLFLISALTLVGRSRRETLVTGVVFASAVFATYFLIGLGFFTIVRTASSFTVIAAVIRWILFAALVVFAGMSLYDAWLAKNGRSSEMHLQLPGVVKRKIHGTIRSQARTSSIVVGAITMGFLVSLFELACTGQIYLPTIIYMVRVQRTSGSYLLLLFYNVGFIIPLLAVFGLVYAGTGAKVIVDAFTKSLSGVKMALAVVFAALAVLTVIT